MIKVTKLNREVFYINPSLIETVEKTPDTVITLINGKKFVVAESIEQLIEIIMEYYDIVGVISPQIVFDSYEFDANSNVNNSGGNKSGGKSGTTGSK